MENRSDLKNSFRELAKLNLRALEGKNCNFSDKNIQNLLRAEFLKCSKIQSGIRGRIQGRIQTKRKINVLIYAPMNIEVNIFPFIFWLKKQRNVRIFMPFVLNETFKIVPFRIPLRKNKYNIFEARDSKFWMSAPDIAIVPVLGVDKNFARIGFGKGMYDRFYATLKRKPINIFVSRILYIANAKIADKHDILGDIIIARHHFRGFYNATHNSWIPSCWCDLRRVGVFYRQKNLHSRKCAEKHPKTGTNQSKRD